MQYNISESDRSFTELFRTLSFIVTDICEQQFMEDATKLSLSKNKFYILKMFAKISLFNLNDIPNILSVSNAAIGKYIIEKYYNLKIKKQVEIFKKYTSKEKKEFSNYLRAYISNTLHEDRNTNILCLQCDSFFGENCIVHEKKGYLSNKTLTRGIFYEN